jgi:hypothetical protein
MIRDLIIWKQTEIENIYFNNLGFSINDLNFLLNEKLKVEDLVKIR